MKLKRSQDLILGLLKWVFALTVPFWIYGMLLALQKFEFQPVAAMLILNGISVYCFYSQIIKRISKKGINTDGGIKDGIINGKQ